MRAWIEDHFQVGKWYDLARAIDDTDVGHHGIYIFRVGNLILIWGLNK